MAKVDWVAVDARLPTAIDEESRAARRKLFTEMDYNCNGGVSLTELQSTVPKLFESKQGYRRKGTTAVPIVPVKNFKPAVKCAYMTVRDVLPHEDELTLSPKQLHAFLVCLRHYIELLVLFEKIDSSDDGYVNFRECKKCIGKLKNWSVTEALLEGKFPDKNAWDGGIEYDDFAEWCISQRFGDLDLKLDEDKQEEPAEEEKEEPAPTEAEEQTAEPASAEPSAEKEPAAEQTEEPASAEPAAERPKILQEAISMHQTSWISDLKLKYQSFEVGARVESIYAPTGDWCLATVAELRNDGVYVIDWDPLDDYVLRSDREKSSDELRTPVPKEEPPAEKEKATEPVKEEEVAAEPEEEKLDADDSLRLAAGLVDRDNYDPVAMMKEQKLVEAAFKDWDIDQNGSISVDELHTVLERLNPKFTREFVEELWQKADTNKDDTVDYMEFVAWLFRDEKN